MENPPFIDDFPIKIPIVFVWISHCIIAMFDDRRISWFSASFSCLKIQAMQWWQQPHPERPPAWWLWHPTIDLLTAIRWTRGPRGHHFARPWNSVTCFFRGMKNGIVSSEVAATAGTPIDVGQCTAMHSWIRQISLYPHCSIPFWSPLESQLNPVPIVSNIGSFHGTTMVTWGDPHGFKKPAYNFGNHNPST